MRTMLLAAAVLTLMAPAAVAQTAPGETRGQAAAPAGPAAGGTPAAVVVVTPDLSRARRIIGQGVYNPAGDRVGEIEDLILDPKTGQVQQAIIGVGGFLGLGEKDVAVPFAELKIEETALAPAAPPGPPVGGSTAAPADRPAPAPATAVQPVRARFVIDATKEQLRDAPAYREERRAGPGAGEPAPGGTRPPGGTGR